MDAEIEALKNEIARLEGELKKTKRWKRFWFSVRGMLFLTVLVALICVAFGTRGVLVRYVNEPFAGSRFTVSHEDIGFFDLDTVGRGRDLSDGDGKKTCKVEATLYLHEDSTQDKVWSYSWQVDQKDLSNLTRKDAERMSRAVPR